MKIFTTLITVLLALLAGCAQGPTKAPVEAVFYPPLPQKPRIQYLTIILDEGSIGEKASSQKFESFLLGVDPDDVRGRGFGRPVAIAHRPGRLYVADRDINAIVEVDLETGTFFEIRDERGGPFVSLVSVNVGPDDLLYVVDQGRREILVFNQRNEFETSYELPEAAQPVDVLVADELLYVSDLSTYEILVLDKETGEIIDSFGGPGDAPGSFNKPTFMARAPDENIVVTDLLNYRAQLFDSSGSVIDTYGSAGQGRGSVVRPKGLDVDRDGNIYLADSAHEWVQIFDIESGTPRMTFGKQGTGLGSTLLTNDVSIDYDNVAYFQHLADPEMELQYIVYVSNGMFGVSVFGFGDFKGPLIERKSNQKNAQRPAPQRQALPGLEDITD